MITSEGIIILLGMYDVSRVGRMTFGVKMINLDENVKVAKIAKVREKVSDGDHEIENIEDMENADEIINAEKENFPEDEE